MSWRALGVKNLSSRKSERETRRSAVTELCWKVACAEIWLLSASGKSVRSFVLFCVYLGSDVCVVSLSRGRKEREKFFGFIIEFFRGGKRK